MEEIEAIAFGAISVPILLWICRWLYRNWRNILVFFIVLKIGFFLYVHLFSYQTADLRSVISDAEDKVTTKVVGFTRYNQWDNTSNIVNIDLLIDRPSAVRVKSLKVRCTTWMDDHDFVNDYLVDPLPANVSGKVSLSVSQTSYDNRVECHPISVRFVDEDFYRKAGKLDWTGAAGVDDRRMLTAPAEGEYTSYRPRPITFSGSMTNTTGWAVKEVTVSCTYFADNMDGDSTLSQDFDIAIPAHSTVSGVWNLDTRDIEGIGRDEAVMCYVSHVSYQ